MILKLVAVYWEQTLKIGAVKTEKKARGRLIGLIAIAVYALVLMYSFSASLAASLNEVGALMMLPALLMTGASALVILSSLFSARDILFAYRDRDMLSAMPVKTWQLAASRVLIMLSYESLFTLVMMIPMFIVCGRYVEVNVYYVVCAVLGCLLAAAAPVFVGAVVGTALSALLAGFRGAKFLRYAVLAVFALGIMALSMSSGYAAGGGALSAQTVMQMEGIVSSVRSFMPTVGLFCGGFAGEPLKLAAFVAVSLALIVLMIFAAVKFSPVLAARTENAQSRAPKAYRVRETTPGKALMWREAKMYTSSALYVFNTAFGLLLLVVGAVVLIFLRDKLLAVPLPDDWPGGIEDIVPYIMGFCICMCCISASSISMEGRRFWLIRSMPVSPKKLLTVKYMFDFLLDAAFSVVVSTVLMFVFELDPVQRVVFYVLPLAYCLFSAVFGLVMNLHMPKLDWTNEAAVVKQSGAVLAAVLVGMGISLFPITLCIFFGSAFGLAVTAALVIASVIMIIWLGKGGVRRFCEL